MMLALVRRDLGRAWAGGIWLPVLFLMLVAILYPFAVGPDTALLARNGGAIIWIAAILSAVLPIDRLLEPDSEAGFLDQYFVRGIVEEQVALAKLLAHWISFGPLILIAAIPAALLMGLEGAALWRLELALALGTPGLAALSLMTAGFTLGIRQASGLAGLLLLPLAIPVTIFGASTLYAEDGSAPKLLAAASLFLVALTPFITAASLRANRS